MCNSVLKMKDSQTLNGLLQSDSMLLYFDMAVKTGLFYSIWYDTVLEWVGK